MSDVKQTRRGVYLDLSVSPYEYRTPYGDIFKFSSKKKLDMYTRDLLREIERVNKFLARKAYTRYLYDEAIESLYRTVYLVVYHSIEG